MLTSVHIYETKRLLWALETQGRGQAGSERGVLELAPAIHPALNSTGSLLFTKGQLELRSVERECPFLPMGTTDRWVLTHSGKLADLEAEETNRDSPSLTQQSGSPHWTKP